MKVDTVILLFSPLELHLMSCVCVHVYVSYLSVSFSPSLWRKYVLCVLKTMLYYDCIMWLTKKNGCLMVIFSQYSRLVVNEENILVGGSKYQIS